MNLREMMEDPITREKVYIFLFPVTPWVLLNFFPFLFVGWGLGIGGEEEIKWLLIADGI